MCCFNDSQWPIVCFIDTKEKCTGPEQCRESHVTANSFGNIKLKHLRESKQTSWVDLVTYSNKMKSLVTDMSTVTISLHASWAICFSYFQSSPWWCPGEDCPIYVTCEQQAVQVQCTFLFVSSKQTIGSRLPLKQCSGAILYPNLVHFHAQNFIWWHDVFKF